MKKLGIKILKFIFAMPAMLSVVSLLFWFTSIIFAGPVMIPVMAVIDLGYSFDYAGLGVFLLIAFGWIAFSLLGMILDDILYEDDEMFKYAAVNIVTIIAIIFLYVNGLPF